MHRVEKDCLIDFFETIDEQFEYVVMRNADELPFDNFSNDIDILIEKTSYVDFERIMKEVYVKHGFERVERTSFHGIECYTFYNIQTERPYSIKIDLFFNIEGGGVRYYDFEDVIKFKFKNTNGIYIFDTVTEGLLTAIKTLAAGGKLKDKYLNNFLENEPVNKNELIEKCPSKTLIDYLNITLQTKQNPKQISRKKIMIETYITNLKKSIFATSSRTFFHYKTEIKRMFNKQYLFALVSTNTVLTKELISRLQDDSRIVFRSKSDRFVSVNIKENDEKSSVINSISCGFNYMFSYVFKVMPLQRESKIVIYENYSYDCANNDRWFNYLKHRVSVSKPNFIFSFSDETHKEMKNEEALYKQMHVYVIKDKESDQKYIEFLHNIIKAMTCEVIV